MATLRPKVRLRWRLPERRAAQIQRISMAANKCFCEPANNTNAAEVPPDLSATWPLCEAGEGVRPLSLSFLSAIPWHEQVAKIRSEQTVGRHLLLLHAHTVHQKKKNNDVFRLSERFLENVCDGRRE